MRRRFRLLSILLAVVFLIALVPPVGAATPAVDQPLTMDEAISLLQLHGIVKGDERGNLNLYSNITRAEAAAIFVRAKNMSAFAPQLADLVPFNDARGKWFSGEVAMAYQLGLMKGDPDGRFRPNDQITYAEFLTVLLRMIGQEPSGPWDPATIMWKAAEVGILPSGVTSSQPAVRQQAFWALASAMTVPLANGRTLLQDFDMVPPDLRVGSVAAETTDESITLTGTATGAYKVLVNGKPATLESRTGAFEAKVDLEMGRNDFTIQAFDRAGNVAQRTVTIERKPKVSVIEIEGPELIKPNTSVKLTIKAYDEKGKEVALEDATYTLSNKNHQFDPKTNTLKTGSQRGKATLTVTAGSAKGTYTFEVMGLSDKVKALRIEPINEGRAPAPDKKYEVKVSVVDDEGNVVKEDYGREIELKAYDRDITISPKTATTVNGVATFTIESEDEGVYLITASSDKLDEVDLYVEFLESPRIVLTSSKEMLVADGKSSTRIRAYLMDDRGREIKNKDEDIIIVLEELNTDGYFEDGDTLVIEEGESRSDDYVTFVAGFDKGPVEIVGYVESDHDYPVQRLVIPVDATLDGVAFDLSYKRNKDGTITVTLKVVDEEGARVRKGSYAFQLELAAWDEKGKAVEVKDGLPDGLSLAFEDDDSTLPLKGTDVRGRTFEGRAIFTLDVDSDISRVRIKTVSVGRTTDAYHPEIGWGSAVSSKGLESDTLTIRFN